MLNFTCANHLKCSNIGNDVNALWKHYDKSVTEDFLVHRQQIHVSILSVCSFAGRLLSGESCLQESLTLAA
jgi:hypothetical protein